MRKALLTIALLLGVISSYSQSVPSKLAQREIADTLSARLLRRTTVQSKLKINKVLSRNGLLDVYFSATLEEQPWEEDVMLWFRSELSSEWERHGGGKIGRILTNSQEIEDLVVPSLGKDGNPVAYRYTQAGADRRRTTPRFIRRAGAKYFPQGMSDRYIALWQSHGRYYNETDENWSWQRATLFRTVEDMYTQSYVLPFLIPMLENAGAYVMTPRERDTQWREIITDNDPSFEDERDDRTRKPGSYSETGLWTDAGQGFADARLTYTIDDNPFLMGTARQAACSGDNADAQVYWTPEIEQRGEYAVYISYKTLPRSTSAAHYTVHHLGGDSEFEVNQQIGGSTWIYLGTFEFGEGSDGYVRLDNRGEQGGIVTADAVKIGGGMGKIERGGATSGLPSYIEGALYWMRWAGVDTSLTRQWETDYTQDYASRGAWTEMMHKDKGVPFDLSLAFHSDAGVTPNDSTIGTLAIYTLLADKKRKYDDGRDRILARTYAQYVQDQVVNDIREDFDPKWSRRHTWNKSYSECRTTGIPGMILELLSHQNFADMKFGLDPAFRFTVSRAVYKGMLKTLSEFYGCSYKVQPLPVNSFSAVIENGKAHLSWKPTEDSKEPTATPEGYMVYTRIDDGVFDEGQDVGTAEAIFDIEPGHIYSYKVAAYNEGGLSFPSEILSVGLAQNDSGKADILIVNNFDRVSAPYWVDSPEYAGFDSRLDSGVPYIKDISYIGETYEFRRSAPYVDDYNPGFGGSYTDKAGLIVAGNSFDYPYVHGKSLMELGYSFCSKSRDAFVLDTLAEGEELPVLDLICGKQKTTKTGAGVLPDRFQVFPAALRDAISAYTSAGGSVFISGSDIASDSVENFETEGFIHNVLGYKYVSSFGTGNGVVGGMEFHNSINSEVYCVECPDAIAPAGKGGRIMLRYGGSNSPAAVLYKADKYKVVSLGVPLETIKKESDRTELLRKSLQELRRR